VAEKPAEMKDPIVYGSLNWHITIASICLAASIVWMFYDETVAKRPWKGYQDEFVERYDAYLNEKLAEREQVEERILTDPKLNKLRAAIKEAERAAAAQIKAIDRKMNDVVSPRVFKLTKALQVVRSEVMALTYEYHHAEGQEKEEIGRKLERVKSRISVVRDVPRLDGDGETETLELDYYALGAALDEAKARKSELLKQRAELDEPKRRAMAAYEEQAARLREGLSPTQVRGLIQKVSTFKPGIKQIHVEEYGLVERCETCHLGIREPIDIPPGALGDDKLGRMFVSHPDDKLLRIHSPEKFGCTPCHNGNGSATISAKEGHGLIKHWLWPLYDLENVEAGCVQCHQDDIYLAGAETHNGGKELFRFRGCWGCHPREGFDVERSQIRQTELAIKAVEATIDRTKWEYKEQEDIANDPNASEAEYTAALAKLDPLTLKISNLESELLELQRREQALSKQAKNVGPSLRPIQSKLKPAWIEKWIKNPHAFRPTTRMPEFRLDDQQVSAIAAAIWQAADPPDGVAHGRGDAEVGKELFEARGCQACHAAEKDADGEWIGNIWGPELSRVAEKANYNYIVEWIHDTPDWSLMPNLRLTVEESEHLATYLMSLSDASANRGSVASLEDPQLAEQGAMLIRHFGCAGCHDIAGFEDAGKIGTDLTVEGSKPMDRLDFGLFTRQAKREHWYDHKNFFIKKLTEPAFFDQGKTFESDLERARMPNFGFSEQEVNQVVTYLLGSVDSDLPEDMYYDPDDWRREAIREGWWVIQKYNCMGCHQILPDQTPPIQELEQFSGPENMVKAPPSLVGVGARLNPEWLAKFLRNPAMSDHNIHRNGVRTYLDIRMPTFNLWDEEIGALVKFFEAMADQTRPYIPPPLPEMTDEEMELARNAFLDSDCLNCHASEDASEDDATIIAPSFVHARYRLKPQWTKRWLYDPAKLMPGTKMPAGLFYKTEDRYEVAAQQSEELNAYHGDHLELFQRYISLIDETEANILREVRDVRRPPQPEEQEQEAEFFEEEEFFEEDE